MTIIEQIKLDGVDLKDLNVRWLRSHIGLVAQTPNLFNVTIEDNVRMGKLDASFKEIKASCMKANAHSFISELRQVSHKLQTKNGTNKCLTFLK